MRTILLCGQAGSGKDTIATKIELILPGMVGRFALADPLKEFAKAVFLFSDRQLWGPSSERNMVDPRGRDLRYWDACRERLWNVGKTFTREWCEASGRPTTRGTGQGVIEWFESLTPYPFEPGQCVDAYDRVATFTPRRVLQTLGTDFGRAFFGPDVWAKIALERIKRRAEIVSVVTDGRFANEVDLFEAAGAKVVRVINPEETEATVQFPAHASERGLLSVSPGRFHAVIKNAKSEGLEVLGRKVRDMLEGFGWIE